MPTENFIISLSPTGAFGIGWVPESKMTTFKKSYFKPSSDWIDALPADRREKIEAGAAAILKTIMPEKDRKAG